jgi:AcrR family transcriptional regulator
MTPNNFTQAGMGVADALREYMLALLADSSSDCTSTLYRRSRIVRSDKLYDKGRRVRNVFAEPSGRECPLSNKITDLSANGARMTRRPMDRRVARTRATLQRALNALTLKKGYEAITIEEICEAANVGRSTFYAHYTSKDDLKRSGLEHLRRQLLNHQRAALAACDDASKRSLAFSLPMFEHARDHIELYRALVGNRGGAIALGTIRQILSDLVRNELRTNAGRNPNRAIPREPIVQYVVGAYMAVLTWWLDGGAKLPPHQMDVMFRRLATEGIGPGLADLAQ